MKGDILQGEISTFDLYVSQYNSLEKVSVVKVEDGKVWMSSPAMPNGTNWMPEKTFRSEYKRMK